MSRGAPNAPTLPAWPAMLTTELACAYTSLSEVSFRLFAGKHGVQPVECAGLAVTRWKKSELDVIIDRLPARGTEMPTEQAPAANDPASDALKRAEKRARRG